MDHSRSGSSKAPAVSSNQYSDDDDAYGSFEQEDRRQKRKPNAPTRNATRDRSPPSDREPSSSTAVARRPPMCMYCRRNPKVGDSAFCGRRCMQDAMSELGGRPSPQSGGRKRRDTRSYQYQNSGQMFPDSVQSPDWYQSGYNAGYGQAYPGYNQQQQGYNQPQQGYNQPQQGYFPPQAQPSYNVPQQAYPGSQGYYPQMQWPAYPTQPGRSSLRAPGPAFDLIVRPCSWTSLRYPRVQSASIQCNLKVLWSKLPEVNPKNFRMHFCSQKCGQTAENQGPMLLDVPATDPKFADIVKQFNDTWKGGYGTKATPLGGAVPPAGNPTIKRVCKVVNTKAVETRYQAYRYEVVK
ncbi:hypothetical protein FRC00_012488 [Tulasnella sp. 408]|nr:hypothetical protein FRC00_012488 [Tulasnella sp. 408]